MAVATVEAQERVLSTLNRDGSRRWLLPVLSRGRFLTARRITACALILIFTLLPYVRLRGRPAILLDLVHRQFTILGFTFLPSDSVLLALFLLSVLLAIFLLTALFGRVWCGWACPQTVYMEFLFRPIERLFDGPPTPRGRQSHPRRPWRTMLKYAVFFLVAAFIANTFLAYFVGVETLSKWVRQSPIEHPGPFLVMAVVTAAMLFDFSFFREQVCIVACPYGRLQAVLLDKQSLIVSYDVARGEPRGKVGAQEPKRVTQNPDASRAARLTGVALPQIAPASDFSTQTSALSGDCVDCGLCVATCPTGIDIRDGLQMECIGCAQCIDACNKVMTRIKRPAGLIRYSSQSRMEGGRRRVFRPRVIIYPLVFAVVAGLFTYNLVEKPLTDVTVLRGLGSPFTVLPNQSISNTLQLRLTNRDRKSAAYTLELLEPRTGRLVLTEAPLVVAAGQARLETVYFEMPRSVFKDGTCTARLRLSDDRGLSQEISYRLLGPLNSAHEKDDD